MHQCFFVLVLTVCLIHCKSFKLGIFDNITVHLRGLDKTKTEDTIFIDYDDNLSKHIGNKPSEVIIIHRQNIPKLTSNSIAELPKLQNLTLSENGIREIHPGAFKNVPNLKILNLSKNELEEIRNGVFNNLGLKELYLDQNKISRIGYKAFGNLQLKNLFLNGNKISRWSKDWLDDGSVTVLNLGFNLIEELPSHSFRLMSKPVNENMSVVLSHNRLRKIGKDVFNGFDFNVLFLDGNLIDRLDPDAFNGVNYINTLNLNNNSLMEISGGLFSDTQVDVLMLEDNKLRCISTEIFKPLVELDIDGNPITCFCVRIWLDWRGRYSNPSIYHITNLEEECL